MTAKFHSGLRQLENELDRIGFDKYDIIPGPRLMPITRDLLPEGAYDDEENDD